MCWSAFLQHLPTLGHSYCIDGFIVHYQSLSGTVMREEIDVVSSYSFEWNREVQTVTVEAYNSLGSSTNNINMTLERRPKRELAVTVNLFCYSNMKVKLLVLRILVTMAWVLHYHYYISAAGQIHKKIITAKVRTVFAVIKHHASMKSEGWLRQWKRTIILKCTN